jgi:hypothetical protein
MSEPNTTRLRELVKQTIGPAPWYWRTFPAFRSQAGQRFVWTHQGAEGPLAFVVTLSVEQEPNQPRLALNTYCRPFLVPPHYVGIWCPEGRSLRFACFDPDQLKGFDVIYAGTPPIADFEVPVALEAGTHKIDVPAELATVEELIVPTSFKTMSNDEPAFAMFVFYLHAGLVEVLPQKWFTAAQYDVGYQWIARAARDPESHRLAGEGFRIGTFVLEEDGCHLDRWIETSKP